LSLVGAILLLVIGFPFFTSIAAVILGIVGLKQIKEGNGTGDAFAIVGIIVGAVVVLIVWVALTLLLLWLIGAL